MKHSILFIILLLQFSPVFPKALLEVSFTFFDNGEEITLKAGLDTTATDSIDRKLGEYEMPPLPPWGTFDIRFKLKGTNGTLIDYRHIDPADSSFITEEYIITSQLSGASAELQIKYNISDAQEFIIADLADVPLSEIKETGAGIINIQANITSFKIKVKYENPFKLTGLDINRIEKPDGFSLDQNYPNPFNPVTTISYTIQKDYISPLRNGGAQGGAGVFVQLKVYDMLGREAAILVNEEQAAGKYTVQFSARSYRDGRDLASGIYFYRLTAGNFTATRKMMIMR